MKKLIGLFLLAFLTLEGGCQEDKVFKEMVTFEKGFNFVKGGPAQNMPFTGTGAAVTWETLTGKPLTFPSSAHTHTIGEVTGIPEVDLLSAIASLQVLIIPKLTTDQIASLTPTAGSLVYDTSLNVLKIGSGVTWKTIITNQ